MPLSTDTIIGSDYKFSQTNRFSTEDSYQSYLTNLLSTELDTIVHREYRCKTGRLDIYIPIVNAIIECKLDKSRACQAQRQLDRYNQCFNSDALFISIANSSDENYILSKLKPLVSKRKKEFDLKSKKMLSWLKIVDIFIYDTIEAKNKVKSIYVSIKSLLDEAKLFIKKNSKIELIEKQLSRIEKDWFRYQDIHGLLKPKLEYIPSGHIDKERFKLAWLLHPETKLHPSYYTETPRKHGLFSYIENKAISSIIRKFGQANNMYTVSFYEPWDFEGYSRYWFCYEFTKRYIKDIHKQECFNLIEDQLSPISREYLNNIKTVSEAY